MPAPAPKTFKKLYSMGPQIVAEVDKRLLAGATPSSVAQWLHEDMHLFEGLMRSSLKKNLERYRAIDLRDRVVNEIADATAGKDVVGIRKKMLAMDELETLAWVQKGRVDKLLGIEANMPNMVLKTASEEIRLLKETLVELGKLQLDTGIIKRAPKTVSGQLVDPETGQKRQFKWTEEQETLYRELEHMDVEDAVVVNDGA